MFLQQQLRSKLLHCFSSCSFRSFCNGGRSSTRVVGVRHRRELARTRFKLRCEGMDKIERAAKSSVYADSMVALISSAGLNGALNGIEKEDVLNSILLTPNRDVWVASDLSRLVDSQVYLDNLLFYMLPSEWDKWKANGVQGGENTATTTRTRCTTTRRPPHWHFRTRTWSSADMSRFPMAVFRPKKHTHWLRNGLRKR